MRTRTTSLCVLLLIALASPTPAANTHFWSMSTGDQFSDRGTAVAVDAAGNVFVAGTYLTNANFGGGNLVPAGNQDIFLVKFSPTGEHLWSKSFGGTNLDQCNAIAVDNAGAVYITGSYLGTINFGGSNLTSVGLSDVYVAKFSSSGAHSWSRSGGSSTADDIGQAIALNAFGTVAVAGVFSGTINFGAGPLNSAGLQDGFVHTFGSNDGGAQFGVRMGGTGADNAFGLAADSQFYVTGVFNGTVDFGSGNVLVSAGGQDVFVAKYSSIFTIQWARRGGGTTTDNGFDVALDVSGNVLATGTFQGTGNFGGANLVSLGADEVYLAKYTSANAHVWSQRFGGFGTDTGRALATDVGSSVYLLGTFQTTANFGGSNLTTAGGSDIVLAKYDSDGNHQWSERHGGGSSEEATGIGIDPWAQLSVTGSFPNTVNFGGSPLVSNGGSDIYVAKFSQDPRDPNILSIDDVGNDQGRKVRIRFGQSAHDWYGTPTPVVKYEVYRRNDPLAVLTPALTSLSRSQLLDEGWLEVASTAAHRQGEYTVDAPTDADSTISEGGHMSSFFIRGATELPGTYFDSPIDSGYSKDNLAPGVPDNFVYDTGDLTWDESAAEDFDYFTVYGSNTDSFGSATLVNYTVAPTMDVNTSPYVFYFITATDFAGNEGKPAKVNTLSGVGGTPKSYVLSVTAYPNPFNPKTTIRYTVPARGRVTVTIYDVHGAPVTTLFSGERAPGAYSLEWDGRAQDAAVGSGVYFARIEQSGATRVKKLVLLK